MIPNEDDIRTIGAAQNDIGLSLSYVGLQEATDISLADIIFYCDDDRRWVHPEPNQWLRPSAWYDPVNEMILDDYGKAPGCLEHVGVQNVAQTYRNPIPKNRRPKWSKGAPRQIRFADKATVTICGASYFVTGFTGFFSITSDPSTWRVGEGEASWLTISEFRLLSVAIVHEVSFSWRPFPRFPWAS